jgi:hypothetical protein
MVAATIAMPPAVAMYRRLPTPDGAMMERSIRVLGPRMIVTGAKPFW